MMEKIFTRVYTIACILGIILCLMLAKGCSKKNHPKTSAQHEKSTTQFI